MPYLNRDIERCLKSKFGFEPVQEKPDHRWVMLDIPGARRVRTRISHSRQTVGPDLESRMADQLKVTTRFFRGMLDCSISCTDYYQYLKTIVAG